MKTWNPKANEKSKMILLSLSIQDEMSTKGIDIALVELLFEIGLLIGTYEKDWSLLVDIDKK